MADKVIYQAPGFIIALSNVPQVAVPYDAVTLPDGGLSGGFADLRGRTDLVEALPAAQKSAALRETLKVINAKGSPFMSISSEIDLFPCDRPEAGMEEAEMNWPRCYIGAALDIVFRDVKRNEDPDQFLLLSKAIVNNAKIDPDYIFCFEFIIEPLRHFFDHQGCYTLNLKLQGYGESEPAAAAAFERAGWEMQRAFRELTRASFFSFLRQSG